MVSIVLTRWLVTTLAILMVPALVPSVTVDGISAALAAAAVLGVLNILIRPVLVFLTFPVTIVTFGVFLLFINAFLFEMAGFIVKGVRIESFWGAFLASLIISVVSSVVNFRPAGFGWRVVSHYPRGYGGGTRGREQVHVRRPGQANSDIVDLTAKTDNRWE